VLAQCVLLWSGAADANAVDEALARLEAARARIITPSDSAPVHYSSMPVAQPMTQPVTLGLMPNASTTVAVAKPSATLPAVPPGGESFGACTTKSECPGDRMMCVEGVCRCPVLFTGENCMTPRTPTEEWCLTPLPEWPTHGPRYFARGSRTPLDFTSCAVVASSGNMKRSGFGAQIDAHTAVFRFNEAPTGGLYAEDVGRFSTLRFQNRDRSGYAQNKGEICVVRRGKWSKGQDSGGKCLFQQMPEPVELYVDGHWKKNRGGAHWIEADPGKPWFSNGMAGLAFAMHMCGRVDVYGFTFGQGYYFKKYVGPAKSWGRKGGFIRPPSKEYDNRHSWIRESTCLARLAEEYPSQMVVQASTLQPTS